MTSPDVPPNAYTNAPKQHSNLILSSLQLLFWLFFRPTAWNNHLANINPALHPDSDSPRLPWRNLAFWRLIIPGYVVLPVITNLLRGLVLWILGASFEKILVSMTSGMTSGVGAMVNLWRPLVSYPFLYLWNTLIYQLDKRPTHCKFSFLRWNCAFWDEWQYLPIYGLDKHLLLVMEHNPTEGRTALEVLSTSRQRWAVQAVQIELTARKLEGCADVEAISQVQTWLGKNELESPASELLRRFNRLSEDVNAALNQQSTYNQRLRLWIISDLIDIQLREFNRSSHPYASRFSPIAKHWGEIIINYERELALAVELRQEIESPYIVGQVLDQYHKTFIGRTNIASRIEKLLLDQRRPPLLLYGQRRMGKTSLLDNLGRLLPNSIIPLFVDLQGGASSVNDHAGFLYNIARGMVKSAQQQSGLTLPPLTREALVDDPFTSFDEWLDAVELALEANIALLALDEFEVLDTALSEKRFDETAVLGMLRNLIQHRPRFKVLLSGSHTLEEFQSWASYLINVQVVHISYLEEKEARQLIEQPIKDFALRYEANAVDRIIALTRCHPFLVQLLCAEIVALKNEQEPSMRRLANLADVEAAIPEALSSGIFFFSDLARNQVDNNGLMLLHFLAALGEDAIAPYDTLSQHFPELDSTLPQLLQREIIEEIGAGYRFQVELIRRWFAK